MVNTYNIYMSRPTHNKDAITVWEDMAAAALLLNANCLAETITRSAVAVIKYAAE